MAGEWRGLSDYIIEHTGNMSRISRVETSERPYWAYQRVEGGYRLIDKYSDSQAAKAAAARASNAEA